MRPLLIVWEAQRPNREQVLTNRHQQLRDLPEGAVVLAEDETHINLLPWVRATWIPTAPASMS
jgi:hypothetical protein